MALIPLWGVGYLIRLYCIRIMTQVKKRHHANMSGRVAYTSDFRAAPRLIDASLFILQSLLRSSLANLAFSFISTTSHAAQ